MILRVYEGTMTAMVILSEMCILSYQEIWLSLRSVVPISRTKMFMFLNTVSDSYIYGSNTMHRPRNVDYTYLNVYNRLWYHLEAFSSHSELHTFLASSVSSIMICCTHFRKKFQTLCFLLPSFVESLPLY